MSELQPQVGQWYVRQDTGELFRVVAIDPLAGSIEIQDFDGNIEELEPEVWQQIELEAIEAPEDCTGPYDELPNDQTESASLAATQRDWRTSLELQSAAGPWHNALAQEEWPLEQTE